MDFILLILHFDPISVFTALYGLCVESSLQLRAVILHHDNHMLASNHMLATYMKTFAVYMLVCKNLAEFTQRCLHHDQSWRNSDWTAGASKASQSFAAALLALSCHLFLDSDWTKHTCTNSAVFALESLSKNDLMICSDQSWRNSDWTVGASKASQSFAAALLALSCHLFLDSDWIKHTCTNSAVFALESLSKNDLMICSNKDFIYAGNDLCHSFKNGNPGGFVGLGHTP